MEDLADQVRNVRFTPRRGGYDMGSVDLALDELVEALEAGRDGAAIAALCDAMVFRVVRLGLAYQVSEVDDFLDRVVREAGGSAPATTPTTPAPAPPRADRPAYEAPAVVEEQRGWFERLRGRRD